MVDSQPLLTPFKLGSLNLPNRVVMAALTRVRCDPKTGVPNDLLLEYYSARASAGLIFTEASSVSPEGNAFPGAGNLYN